MGYPCRTAVKRELSVLGGEAIEDRARMVGRGLHILVKLGEVEPVGHHRDGGYDLPSMAWQLGRMELGVETCDQESIDEPSGRVLALTAEPVDIHPGCGAHIEQR